MGKIDFFISYSHYDLKTVKGIVNALEKKGAKCWYAPRDVMGRYAKAIVDAIGNAKVFLLCLSSKAAVSEHVLNEIEMAYKMKRTGESNILIEPLCIEPLDLDAPEFDEIMYYIRRINFISPSDYTSTNDIADEVIHKNEDYLGLNKVYKKKERTVSQYYTDSKEEARLNAQNELLRKFDEDVYRKVFSNYENADILDVGCGNGGLLLSRLESDYTGDYRLIGFDSDAAMIKEANKKYKNDNIAFMEADVEAREFLDTVKDKMGEMGIKGFDIIHISMLLLHLKSSKTLLRKLRRLLKPGGIMFIKDIDDGLNFAYPDDNGKFERAYQICANNDPAGERRNGRQIYHDLYDAGFRNISLEKSGFSTIGLNDDEKEDFWNMYFQFILWDAQWMADQNPDDSSYKEDYEWYSDNYDDMYTDFMQEDFAFSLGFQIYLAKK